MRSCRQGPSLSLSLQNQRPGLAARIVGHTAALARPSNRLFPCHGGCARGTSGCAGCLTSRSANPRTAATQSISRGGWELHSDRSHIMLKIFPGPPRSFQLLNSTLANTSSYEFCADNAVRRAVAPAAHFARLSGGRVTGAKRSTNRGCGHVTG